MAISLNGTTGITTPGITNTGAETVVDLTTTGNTILGDASGDTLTVTGGTTTFTQGTANGVAFLNGSKVLTTGSANLTFNGTTLTANTIGAFTLGGTIAGGGNQINNVIIGTTTPLAGAFTTVTASTPIGTASGGTGLGGATPFTSGGVVYASSASVLATGSALVFDGTNLGVGGGSSFKLNVAGTADNHTSGGIQTINTNAGTAAQVGYRTSNGTQNGIFGLAGTGYAGYGAYAAGNAVIYNNQTITLMADDVSGVIKFAAGGNTEQMRLTSTGLGIGTTSPGAKIHIVADNQTLRLTPTTATASSYAQITNTGQTFYIGLDNSAGSSFNSPYAANLYGSGAYPMVFWTNGTERCRIDSSGNLGIGTSSPTRLLDVNGAARIASGVYMNNGSNAFIWQEANAAIQIATNNAERMRITDAGLVGIGTSLPGAKLTVSGANNDLYGQVNIIATGAGADAQIVFSTPLNGRGIYVDDSDTNKLKIYGGAGKGVTADEVTITNTGEVGIGTSSPTVKLDVAGQIRVNTTDNTSNIYLANSGTTYLQLRGNTTSAFVNNPTAGPLVFGTNDTERMRISSAGDVTVSTGNLIIGTAGKGIDFSATASGSGTMTSELLADYEEGTWTPSVGAGLTVVGTFSSNGHYIKIGRQVTIQGFVTGSTSVTATANGVICGGLPFTCMNVTGSQFIGGASNADLTALVNVWVNQNTSNMYAVTTMAATGSIFFTVTYFTD